MLFEVVSIQADRLIYIEPGVPTGASTVFPGCAGLLIGFAHTSLREGVACDPPENLHA